MQLKEKGHLPRLLTFRGHDSGDNRIKTNACHLTSHTCFSPGWHANVTFLLTSKKPVETMLSLEVSLMCFSKPSKSSNDSHADRLAHVWWKIPAVVLWIERLVLLWAGRGRWGWGHTARLTLAAVTDDFFYLRPRPGLANAEPLPFLLIYLCHRSKVHKLLLGAGSFLIGPCFAAGKVVPDGGFCCDFRWRLRGTDVLNIVIPSQNRK